jgi:hypothetical protein
VNVHINKHARNAILRQEKGAACVSNVASPPRAATTAATGAIRTAAITAGTSTGTSAGASARGPAAVLEAVAD